MATRALGRIGDEIAVGAMPWPTGDGALTFVTGTTDGAAGAGCSGAGTTAGGAAWGGVFRKVQALNSPGLSSMKALGVSMMNASAGSTSRCTQSMAVSSQPAGTISVTTKRSALAVGESHSGKARDWPSVSWKVMSVGTLLQPGPVSRKVIGVASP